jgi:DNA-binding response OmpR family regulator
MLMALYTARWEYEARTRQEQSVATREGWLAPAQQLAAPPAPGEDRSLTERSTLKQLVNAIPLGLATCAGRVLSSDRETGVPPHPPLTLQDMTIDFDSRRVTVGEAVVELTRIEFDLLAHLALNAGRILTHRALLQAVWGPEYGDETEYLWTYIKRLRRKIEPDPHNPSYILTHAGVGYSCAGPP